MSRLLNLSRCFALGLALAVLATTACRRTETPGARAADARPTSAANAPAPHLIVRKRKCMGTECEFKGFHTNDHEAETAFARGFQVMDQIEALATSWRDSSEVSHINAAAGREAIRVSPDTMTIVQKAQWVSGLTDGAFDITVGVYKGLWKFDEDNDNSIPNPAEVKKRRALVNYRDVIIDEQASTIMLRRPGQRINLEGIAKGYAVDAAVKAVRAAGVKDFILKAGGDLYAAGRKGDREWRVGIQDPRGPHGRIIFELSLTDQAFNTSGDYERFIMKGNQRYHHILDARTGFPAKTNRSVTILAKSAFIADTLDTAIFAVGPQKGMQIIESEPDVEGVIVDADNRVFVSSGLVGRIVKRHDPLPGP